jgi:predicted CoA-binding protein
MPDLAAAKASLKPGESIDIVDVFRRPQAVPAIVDDCVRLGLKALWLQLGVIHEAAAERARAAGMFVVMDLCIYRERAALEVSSRHAD